MRTLLPPLPPAALNEPLQDPNSLSHDQLISKYHMLRKQLASVDRNPLFPTQVARESRKRVLRAQLAVFGIDRYQTASRQGENLAAGFDCSLWVLTQLSQGIGSLVENYNEISILDVGAIVRRFPDEVQAKKSKKIVPLTVTSIDLNPEDSEQGRKVIKADFFEFAQNSLKDGKKYDIVCLSLCVNFEGCPKRRGRMISLASQLLHNGGLLFLVLPLACIENSRYCDENVIRSIMEHVKLRRLSSNSTAKLWQCICQRHEGETSLEEFNYDKKQIVRTGANRNNFAICLLPNDQLVGRSNSKVWHVGQPLTRSRDSYKVLKTADSAKPKQKQSLQKPRTSNQRKKARRQAKKAKKHMRR